MINYYKIELIQMMENAWRNLAKLVLNQIFKYTINKKILVLIWSWWNWGWAIVCARHLFNKWINIEIILYKDKKSLKEVIKKQLNILRKLWIQIHNDINSLKNNQDLLIDWLIWYNLNWTPKWKILEYWSINWANNSKTKILSLDIPSGIDSTTWKVFNPCIKANYTMTLALPKTAFLNKINKDYFWKIYLADIWVPNLLYTKLKNPIKIGNLFLKNEIIEI